MEILIVDDSKMLRYMTRDALRSLGYDQIHEASDVAEARVQIQNGKIDLVISDFHMPRESGLDLLLWIRSMLDYAKIPVVLLTTEGDKKTIISIVQAGAQAYLLKPLQTQMLGQKLLELSKKYGFQAPSNLVT